MPLGEVIKPGPFMNGCPAPRAIEIAGTLLDGLRLRCTKNRKAMWARKVDGDLDVIPHDHSHHLQRGLALRPTIPANQLISKMSFLGVVPFASIGRT
jgi:hypothetical protein